MKRPISIYLGVLLIFFRIIATVLTAIAIGLDWNDASVALSFETDDPGQAIDGQTISRIVLVFVLLVMSAAVIIDTTIALLVYRGSNRARFTAMTVSSVLIVGTAIGYFSQGRIITLENGGLAGLSLDILILVALSSEEARDFATGESSERRTRRRSLRRTRRAA